MILGSAQSIFLFVFILVYSAIIHEIAHGAVALALGDQTAKRLGRLTLNPLPHLDPFGSLILPFLLLTFGSPLLFAWAKPVPYNPLNFKNPRRDSLLVGLAGPASNFLLAAVFGLLVRILYGGEHALAVAMFSAPALFLAFAQGVVLINIALALFNLIPIPPLDGSRLLFTFFPHLEMRVAVFFAKYGLMGTAFVFFLIFFVFGPVVSRLISFLFSFLTGLSVDF